MSVNNLPVIDRGLDSSPVRKRADPHHAQRGPPVANLTILPSDRHGDESCSKSPLATEMGSQERELAATMSGNATSKRTMSKMRKR